MFCSASTRPNRCQSCVSVISSDLTAGHSLPRRLVEQLPGPGQTARRHLFFADDDQLRSVAPLGIRPAVAADQLLGIAPRHAGQLADQRHAQPEQCARGLGSSRSESFHDFSLLGGGWVAGAELSDAPGLSHRGFPLVSPRHPARNYKLATMFSAMDLILFDLAVQRSPSQA